MRDLDPKLPDVIEIFDKIKELENSGFDLLNTIPDGTCSVQVKYFISAIIVRAKEQCDFCIQTNVGKENPTMMNVCIKNWKFSKNFEIIKQTFANVLVYFTGRPKGLRFRYDSHSPK